METAKLSKIPDLVIESDVNLEKYTTIKLGAIGTIAKCKTQHLIFFKVDSTTIK